jgi:hypothetical protein
MSYYRMGLFAVFVGIAMMLFSKGQGQPQVKSQVSTDARMSDHDKIEKLRLEVAELQKKVAALTQKYETHTHQLRLEVVQAPDRIECNQTVVRWAPAGLNQGSVDKVCRQVGEDHIRVLVAPNEESMITAPPGP